MPDSGETYVPHEDEAENDPNAPHGVNTEDEMLEVADGSDDDSA